MTKHVLCYLLIVSPTFGVNKCKSIKRGQYQGFTSTITREPCNQRVLFHLRQLRLLRRSLTTDTAHALARAPIHSCLDYCNGVLAGMPLGLSNRLQSVLRAAARLALGLPGRAPVMSAIHDMLHWLTYSQRVTFKLCLTTYKCLRGLAPLISPGALFTKGRKRWSVIR